MELFSERNGYVEISDVLIREKITPEIQNAICSCYDWLKGWFRNRRDDESYRKMEKFLWTHFLNQRENQFYEKGGHFAVATQFIETKTNEWFRKLDLIEVSIQFLRYLEGQGLFHEIVDTFVQMLNFEFKRLHFAYRIVNGVVAEISSKEEVEAIEQSLCKGKDNVKMHLNESLKLYAKKPVGDYRNSIKESISAVEAYCREKTGEATLGKALNKLENAGVILPKSLKSAFEKLYGYTNQPDTGIRHALMEDDGNYVPSSEEALFMLVACSAFINYLRTKELKCVQK